MACLRTQGRLPKLPWLKNKKWGAVVCPQLWDNAPAHWNVEPWRGPYTLDDRLPAERHLLWGCEAQIALALSNHQPTILSYTCRPPSTPTATHLHQESTLATTQTQWCPAPPQYQLNNMLVGLPWPRRRKRCCKIENKEKTEMIMYKET